MTTAQIFESRPAAGRRQLVCHWHRDQEGRLAGMWEADIGLVPRL